MSEGKMELKNNIIELPKTNDPDDFWISVAVVNLMVTFGEDKVRSSIKELFQIDITSSSEKARRSANG